MAPSNSNLRGYLLFGFVMASVFVCLHFMMAAMRTQTPLTLDALNTPPSRPIVKDPVVAQSDHREVIDEIRALRREFDRKLEVLSPPAPRECPVVEQQPQQTVTSELDENPGALADDYNPWDNRRTRVARFPVTDERVRVYRTDYPGSSSNYVTSEFWTVMEMGSWEMQTFKVYNQAIIPGRSVVIDFGAWIGPTVLFAASCGAKKVYGLEPDVTAHSELRANVYRNPHLDISITHGCIAHQTGMFEFTHEPNNRPGDSMSKLAFNLKAKGANIWETQCWTLEDFVRRMNIDFSEVHLLKVDCEGCEELIAPSLTSYLDRLKTKPAVWFSTHQFWWQGDVEAAKRTCYNFLKIFKYVYRSPRDQSLELLTSFDAASLDWTETYLLTDVRFEDMQNRP